MFAQQNEQKQGSFTSYSKYLKDKKQAQLKHIRKIKSKKQQRERKNIQHQEQKQKQKAVSNYKSLMQSVISLKANDQEHNNQKQNWVKIDDKAVIVNGRLVYMEDEIPTYRNEHELIDMLKANQITIKSYIYGNKKEILQGIDQNYERKKNAEVEKYINKNMKQQNIVKANHSLWYDEAKQTLFNQK